MSTTLVPDNRAAAGRRRKERHRAIPLVPEVRFYTPEGFEIREADTAGNLVTIIGAPVVYDHWYEVTDRVGTFSERMRPGVAADVMGGDTRFLFNHDGLPLARTVSGTLTLEDTATALRFAATVDVRQQLAQDLVIAIERGDVNQMSVGFLCGQDDWDGDQRSVIRYRSMPDVSAVTYPASPTTSIEIAQRMAMQMPPEAQARIRRINVDLRAGKVLSSANSESIAQALKAMGDVLSSAGADPHAVLNAGQPANPDDIHISDDAADDGAGDAAGDDAAGGVDGAAAIDVDPDVTVRTKPVEVERRDSGSYNDLENQVCSALTDHLQDKGIPQPDVTIRDMSDDWVVFDLWSPDWECQTFKGDYTLGDDGAVTFGDYGPVDRVTTWVPVAERSTQSLEELREQFKLRELRRRIRA